MTTQICMRELSAEEIAAVAGGASENKIPGILVAFDKVPAVQFVTSFPSGVLTSPTPPPCLPILGQLFSLEGGGGVG
jgi:hypothetical protein